ERSRKIRREVCMMAWGRARTYRASKYFNYEKHAAKQPIGWVLSSIGHC
ncbi:4041_t:CDS:2, partial [Rhizophagus irregularis]